MDNHLIKRGRFIISILETENIQIQRGRFTIILKK